MESVGSGDQLGYTAKGLADKLRSAAAAIPGVFQEDYQPTPADLYRIHNRDYFSDLGNKVPEAKRSNYGIPGDAPLGAKRIPSGVKLDYPAGSNVGVPVNVPKVLRFGKPGSGGGIK